MVDPFAAMREQDRRAPVEHTLDEDPLPRRRRSFAVDLRRPEHAHGLSGVEQHAFGRDLVRAVALTRSVVPVARRKRRLFFGDRFLERRRLVGIGVSAGIVDVDRLARDQDSRADVVQERHEQACLRRRVADAIDQEVDAAADRRPQLVCVAAVGGHEPGVRDRVAGRVTAGDVDLPAGGEQPARGGTADQARPAEDQRAPHAHASTRSRA
jgi:hypothetical protein